MVVKAWGSVCGMLFQDFGSGPGVQGLRVLIEVVGFKV